MFICFFSNLAFVNSGFLGCLVLVLESGISLIDITNWYQSLVLVGIRFKMASTRVDLEKFNGDNDFYLWSLKMRAILIQGLIVPSMMKKILWLRKRREEVL